MYIFSYRIANWFSINAENVIMTQPSTDSDSKVNKGKRSPARLPQVTIEENELTIYLLGEAEAVSIEVYDDCQNPVANNTTPYTLASMKQPTSVNSLNNKDTKL